MDHEEAVMRRFVEIAPEYDLTLADYLTISAIWYQSPEDTMSDTIEASRQLTKTEACNRLVGAAVGNCPQDRICGGSWKACRCIRIRWSSMYLESKGGDKNMQPTYKIYVFDVQKGKLKALKKKASHWADQGMQGHVFWPEHKSGRTYALVKYNLRSGKKKNLFTFKAADIKKMTNNYIAYYPGDNKPVVIQRF